MRKTAVIALLCLSAFFAASFVKAQSQPYDQRLQDAWKLAERSGPYQFTSRVTQTTIPAPRLANVGQSIATDHLTIQGQINRKADTIALSLWDNEASAFDPERALEIRIDGGKAQGRVAGGEWQPLDNVTDAFAPGGDVAAYLLAARHVSYLGAEQRYLTPLDKTLTSYRYQFSVDGDALAQLITAQLEDQMRRKGELPYGMHLGVGDAFRQMVANGEAWLDQDGLPQRMRVDIEFPQQQNGERVQIKVQTDFTAFDRSLLALGSVGVSNRLRIIEYDLTQFADNAQLPTILTSLVLLGAAFLLLARLSSRRRQMVISLAVLAALLTGEIAHAAPRLVAFSVANNSQPQSSTTNRPVSAPAFDSHRSPLSNADALLASLPGRSVQAVLNAPQPLLDGPDRDRDGLPDSLEAVWGANPDLKDSDGDGLLDGDEVRRCDDILAGVTAGKLIGENIQSPECANPLAADTDGDTLTDAQEILHLGASPNNPDTDGDDLPDKTEVAGFDTAQGMRYTDPLNPDTDEDGILDGQECPGGNCVNSRGDGGEPDVFVIDNDADGFIGSFDLSPNVVLGKSTPFTRGNPFQLGLANLEQNRSIFVDYQLRPVDPNQIGYGASVLDWPTGDTKGQIQRRLDTTFADANPLPPNMAAPSPYPASHGDMRLVPMLEIEMSAVGAPLPRTTAVQTVTFAATPLVAALQVIKEVEPIEIFGFSAEPEALKIRVNKLSADYSSYSLEIHKASCQGDLSAPVFPAAVLSEGGEVTYASGELAVIGDGGHVAVLKATGLTTLCVSIPKVIEDGTQVPLNFVAPLYEYGKLRLTQTAARQVEVNLTASDAGAQHTVEIHAGSCQNRGAIVGAPVLLSPGAPQTLPNLSLVEIADGKHAAVLKLDKHTLCAPLGNLVNGAASETQMIDAAALAKMDITVSEEGDSNALVAHIPLQMAHDNRTGVTSGFAATMLYDSSGLAAGASWQHQVRMSWWVEMLTDNCTTPPDDFMAGQDEQARLQDWCGPNANRLQLVHVYDGEWQLAGLSVREEHDYNMDIIFEDPANDANPNVDDLLWHLTRGLDEQFVTGVDCVRINPGDSCSRDGQRDTTLETIYNTFANTANGASSATDRWGIPANTFWVEKLDSQLDAYVDMGLVMGTYTPNLLNTHFIQNGSPRAKAPLLLFASENRFRSVALGTADYAATQPNGVSINFAPPGQDAQTEVTVASLNWAPFRYRDADQRWESYPFAEYWDLLELRFKEGQSDLGAGNDEDSRVLGQGMRLLAKSYFTYLYQGRANLVESDATPLGLLDSSASLYLSRQERVDQVEAVSDGTVTATYAGYLVNTVIEPFARHLVKNFGQWNFQSAALREPATGELLTKILNSGYADDYSTVKKLLVNVFKLVRGSLAEDYVHSLKVQSRKLAAGVAGVAVVVLLAGVGAGINLGLQGQSAQTAQQVFSAVITSMQVITLVKMVNEARAAAQGVAGLGAKFAVINQQLAATSKSAQIAGVVGLLILQAINYGGLIANIAINKLSVFGLEANQLAASAISTSIVQAMMVALATTGVGAIVVAILYLIDGLIFLICGFLSDEQTESIPGILFCKGITGWLAEGIAFVIYSQNEITRINDPYRLSYLSFSPGLTNPAAGFHPDANLAMALRLRNTLALASLPINQGIFYGWQFSEGTLRSSRFNYDIVAAKPGDEEDELHTGLSRDEGADPWQVLEKDANGNMRSIYQDVAVRKDDLLHLPAAPGLNQPVPGYLAEGYQVPVQECVNTVVVNPLAPIPICWVRSRGETNYNDLNLVFDVFPATLAAFYSLVETGAGHGQYRLSWANNADLAFPPLIDADGDDLPYDADSNDRAWDQDGDGLSDAVEKARNTNPSSPDSDDDGLSDVQEALAQTDPNLRDSDGDGLSDGDEVKGWSIGYGVDANGAVLASWSRSDPESRDFDRDNISDSQEQVLGLSPSVANDPRALFYDATLTEPSAPLLLTRFEERAGAVTFADSSGSSAGNVASCVTASCPLAGVSGRFGNAVHFNGVDQYLTIPPSPEIGSLTTDFVLAAWVKPDALGGVQAVIQIGPGGPNGSGGVTFGLSDDDLFVRFEGGGATLTLPLNPGVIPLHEWSHIVFANRSDGAYFQVNGKATGFQAGAVRQASVNPQIVIGAAQQPDGNNPPGKNEEDMPMVQSEHFAGAIDEVLIQGAEFADFGTVGLFHGRYNLNDATLRPGQKVSYTSSLENALLSRTISGQRQLRYPAQLTDATSAKMPFVLDATQRAAYDDSFRVKDTTPSGFYTLTQSVNGIINTPTEDVWKDPASNQIFAWDGPQTFVGLSAATIDSGNQLVSLNNKSFTIAGWVRPTNGDALRRGILGRNSGQNDAFPYLVTEGQQLKFGFGFGAGFKEVRAEELLPGPAVNPNVLLLNQWNFVAVRYDLSGTFATAQSVTFFVNGRKLNSVATNATPNSAFNTFLLGRASNIGKVTLDNFNLSCEGDGLGDGEYDFIADGQNLARKVGTETATFPLNITRTFADSTVILVCEDDNGVDTDCAGGDEVMGALILDTNQASIPSTPVVVKFPDETTSCSYNWAMAGWPDLGTLTYSFDNNSLPFIGELRQFEIHDRALSDAEINNMRSHGDQVAQFRLDENSGATSFEDYIAYHQLVCSGTECPLAGGEGRQNVAVRFDGVDDRLGESQSTNLNDKISTDIAGSNSGFSLSLWVKPEKPAGAVHNSVISVAAFTSGGVPKGDLNLVHKTSPREGFVVFYKDEETGEPFSEIGNCEPFDSVHVYGEWVHISINMDVARQTANLYTDSFRCSTPQIPLAATYVPAAGDSFFLGRSAATPAYLPFKGQMDDLYLHRRPLTQQQITSIYRRGVYRHWNLDAPEAAPTVPVKGLMRQALSFAAFADRYSLVDDRADLYNYDGEIDGNPATPNPITFSLWVRAEDLANRKRPLLSIPTQSLPANNDLLIYLDNGTPKIQFYQSDLQLNLVGAADKAISPSVWQHLVFRKDEAGRMSIFVNGYKASSIPTNWAKSKVRSPSGGLILGADTLDSTFFRGRIDEVMVYRAALTDQEIRELYNYQNAWVDEKIENEVTVDADAPTSSLQLQTTYLANASQFLYIASADATTYVRLAELGADAGAGIRWTGAAPDTNDAQGNTWLPLFEPAGDGKYTLSSRTTDSVGNQEAPDAGQTVYVDALPPTVTFNAVAELTRPAASTTEEAVWYIYLEGASGDPLISGTEQPGSGVASINVRLFDKNAETATLFDTQQAELDPATGKWSLRYRLNIANATGEYRATATASDGVGNQASAVPVDIRIDTTAPQAKITFLSSPNPQVQAAAASFPGILGSDSTISGVVTEAPPDVVSQSMVAGVSAVELAFKPLFTHGATFRNNPLPATTVLYLPLDESGRSASPDQSFADVSPFGHAPATCAGAACPQTGAAGKMGQALDFDGVDDALRSTFHPAVNGLTNDFTVAAWIKPAAPLGGGRIVSTARTNSNNGFGLGVSGSKLIFTTYGVQDYVSTLDLVAPNVWQHVAVHLTADNDAEFFLNGQLVETVAGDQPANPDVDDPLLIGATTEPDQAATSQHFAGLIDEVMIAGGRPSAADWQTLLGADPTLYLPFDEPLIHPNTRFSNGAGLAVADLAYLAGSVPAERNLRAAGIVGAGSLAVNEADGALIGGGAPGVLASQNGPFSLAFWARLDDVNSTMGLWIGKFENLSRVLMRATSVVAEFTGKPNLTVTTPNLAGNWQHVLLTYDGNSRVLYLNGAEIGRDTIPLNALDTAAGGLIVAGGTGYLDDLRVYRYALNAREAKALAQMRWLPTDMAAVQAAAMETTWSATVPAGLEGFYELQTRGTDEMGNVDDEAQEVVTWRGIVDSLAPRLLNFSATPTATGIDFLLTVEDFDLAVDTLTMPPPCSAANSTVTPQIYASPWYLSFAAQTATPANATEVVSRTFQATISCQAAQARTNDAFTVCDRAGNCTNAIYTGPNVETPNTPPVANTQTVTVQAGAPQVITLTGSDVDQDQLVYTVVTQPANGVLSGTAPNLVYTPNPGFSGSDSFSFKVNDGKVDSPVATIAITVAAVTINLYLPFVTR